MKELLVNIEKQLKESVKGVNTLLSNYIVLTSQLADDTGKLNRVLDDLEKARIELKEVENKKTHQELKNKLEKEIKRHEGLCVDIAKNHAKAIHDANKAKEWLESADAKNKSAAECEQAAIKKGNVLQAGEIQLGKDRKQLERNKKDFTDKEIEYLIRVNNISEDEEKIKEADKDIARRRANLNATAENLKILEKELREKYGKK